MRVRKYWTVVLAFAIANAPTIPSIANASDFTNGHELKIRKSFSDKVWQAKEHLLDFGFEVAEHMDAPKGEIYDETVYLLEVLDRSDSPQPEHEDQVFETFTEFFERFDPLVDSLGGKASDIYMDVVGSLMDVEDYYR